MLVKPGSKVALKKSDPDDTGPYQSSDDVEKPLAELREELARLQGLLYAEGRRAVLLVLQGMDTSGKDGTIRHVMSGLSPLGVQVQAFKAPSEDELAHDFLWRVHKAVPRHGMIGAHCPGESQMVSQPGRGRSPRPGAARAGHEVPRRQPGPGQGRN